MHPILFKIGPIPVFSYGVMAVTAALGALWLARRQGPRFGMSAEMTSNLFLTVVLAGILGARLLHVLVVVLQGEASAEALKGVALSGGVWYGGVLGGLAAAEWARRHWGFGYLQALDVLSPPAALAVGIGRVGCFLSGCCYGAPTEVAWAVTYRNPLAHRLHQDLPWVPVHPVQLYEFAMDLGIVAVLLILSRRRLPRGTVGLGWIVLYGVGRSVVEIFRGDAVRGLWWGTLSTSQIIGLGSALVAAVILAWRLRAASAGHLVPRGQALRDLPERPRR